MDPKTCRDMELTQAPSPGPDSNIHHEDGLALLQMASEKGLWEMIQSMDESSVHLDTPGAEVYSPLHAACLTGHVDKARTLIKSGADINCQTNDGEAPLHVASLAGDTEMANLLVQSGANINMCNVDGETPLHLACENGHRSVVQLLLSSNSDIDHSTMDGQTPLWVSCLNGNIDVVLLLLGKGANVNMPQHDGVSPLWVACQEGHYDIIQLLSSSGADINRVRNDGTSPLLIASCYGQVSVVQSLLSLGANVNASDHNGISALWNACQDGHISIVRLLLSSGADGNATGTPDGATALYIACQNGHLDVVQLLLLSGSSTNKTSDDGKSPLLIASEQGHHKIVQLLLSSGGDMNLAQVTTGATALHTACLHRHFQVVHVLLASGADTNRHSDDGTSPLLIASENGDHGIVQLLLSSGANANSVQTRTGATALFAACQRGHLEVMQLLLSSGADTNTRCNGAFPLHIASWRGHHDIVQLLLTSRANVNTLDNNGVAPLYIACQQGHTHIVQLLLSFGAKVNSVRQTTGVTSLHKACQNGYLEVVKLLLSSGGNINRQCDNGATPLFLASEKGHYGIVQLLLSSGSNGNKQTSTGATALYAACKNGHLHVVQSLLSSGADNNILCHDGTSILLAASEKAHCDIIHLLVSSGADVNSSRTTDGATALYMACQEGHLDIVQVLLLCGADTSISCGGGVSPLHIASGEGHIEIALLLLSSGAKVNQCSNDLISYEMSPLHVACLKGNLEMVKLLCDAGADINAVRPGTGETALYVACYGGQLKIVQFLLAQLAPIRYKSIEDNMSELHAYCMSLWRLDTQSEHSICLFIQNFAALLTEYKSIYETSDHFTTALDMLLLSRPSTSTSIDTLIANLAYFVAIEGRLNKPLYAIFPETEATSGKLKEIYNLHTTLSILVCVFDVKRIATLLRNIKAKCGHKQFLRMCECLLHQNILHIIPQQKCNNDELVKNAQLFLDLGVDIWSKDVNGRLPLHIACMMENTRLAECYWTAMWQRTHSVTNSDEHSEVIYRRQNYNSKNKDFEFTCSFKQQSSDMYDNRMLDNVGMLPNDYNGPSRDIAETTGIPPDSIQRIIHDFSDKLTLTQLQSLRVDNISNKDMEKLLYFPPCGKVLIRGENKLIFSSVVRLVETISGCIGDLDPCFACKTILSGSVCEGTKTKLLDELDFCLKFLNFDTTAQTNLADDRGYLLARCTPPSVRRKYWRLCPDGRISFASTLYCAQFWQVFLKAINLPKVRTYLRMSRITIDDIQRRSGFVGTLSITWYGQIYSCLPISVDIVPVVDLEDYYCLVRPRYFDHKTVGIQAISFLELSCNKKDKLFIASLSVAQKDAYCLAKIIRGLAKSFISKSGRLLTSDNVIQSYLLKTAMMWIIDPKDQFHQYNRGLNKDSILGKADMLVGSTNRAGHINEVRMWAVKIFIMLKHILQSGHKIYTYNLPFNREQTNAIHVRDKDLAIALCEKCIQIAQPG